MFELQVSNNDVTGGTISVAWCVDVETLKSLSQRGVKDPMVVLVVAPDGEGYNKWKEHRVVVPLKELLTYIEFRSAGKNKIWGFISELGKKTKDQYLERINGRFATDILNSDGTQWSGWLQSQEYGNSPEFFAEPLSVDVPAECFAPEPSALEKTWVNWLFRDKCVDQCHFRKRRLFAYTVQPLIMLCSILFRTLAFLVALLIGARAITLQNLLHPLRTSFADNFEMFTEGSIFIDNKKYDWQRYRFLPAMPVVALALLGIVLLIITFHAWMVPVVILIVLASLGLLVVGGIFGWKAFQKYLDRRAMAAALATPWYLEQDEMDMIVCNGQKRALTVSQLPAKKRTLRLRFFDLKSKVCRPFSASGELC